MAVHPTSGSSAGSSLSANCYTVFKDSAVYRLFMEFITIIVKTLNFFGGSYNKEDVIRSVFFINLVTFPFFFRNAYLEGKARAKLMISAIKVRRISEVILWAERSIDSIGSALECLAKANLAAVQVLELSSKFALGAALLTALPIVLLVTSGFGFLSKIDILRRSLTAHNKLKDRFIEAKQSVHHTDAMLTKIVGPILRSNPSDKDKHHYNLDNENFVLTHMASPDRYKAIRGQAEAILSSNLLERVKGHLIGLAGDDRYAGESKKIRGALSLFDEVWRPNVGNELTKVEKAIELYKIVEQEGADDLRALARTSRLELEELKKQLIEQGQSVGQAALSEIHRAIMFHSLLVLITVLVLTAGALFLLSEDYQVVASSLTIASSGVFILLFLFEKLVSRERFLQIGKALGTLPNQSN